MIDHADCGDAAAIAQRELSVMRGPSKRWRERGGRVVRLTLPFDDIMDLALVLLTLSPNALHALGWSFADRKRLLDHFLAGGKAAQRTDRTSLGQARLVLRLPLRDIRCLRTFVHRELPKAASNAASIDRLGAILNAMP